MMSCILVNAQENKTEDNKTEIRKKTKNKNNIDEYPVYIHIHINIQLYNELYNYVII